MTTLAAKDVQVLMVSLQTRIAALDRLIHEERKRRWTVLAVLQADRALLHDALLFVAASNQDRDPASEPEADTDPARLADPDGVGNSELERCNEQTWDVRGEYFCDREPGHEGKHVNWRGVEWSVSASC